MGENDRPRDFYDIQNEKSMYNKVLHEGTFSATYADMTYMGVRFNKDRVFLLMRMLMARSTKDQNNDYILTFNSISRSGEPFSRFTICEREWYVVDMDGRIYIMSDDNVKQLEDLKPLSFDWHMYDLFPRKLEMNKFYNDSRYEVES